MLDGFLLLASKKNADVKIIVGDFDGRFSKVVSDVAPDGLVLDEWQQPLDKAAVQALLARPSRENRGIAMKEKKINEETFEKNILRAKPRTLAGNAQRVVGVRLR